ncbi:hypothetical protein [Longirhabdus pacifica]|uniref:hypothetical protein n=1 Tax=Longirhabdus pacifica TaxID=2305227 RepID=UPI00100907EA|nr:hypothetical protein [Longirhabdus pacifica]
MPNYKLSVFFDDKDLERICCAKQKVVLIKQSGKGSPLAWVTFDPFELTEITWEDKYGVYASASATQNGATISKHSSKDAISEYCYTFSCGRFTQNFGKGKGPFPETVIPADGYGVYNQSGRDLTFGLYQDVSVNGASYPKSPINAVKVLNEDVDTFSPLEEVQIFLQSNIQQGLVLSDLTSQRTTLEFGNGTDSIGVKFDGARFIQV